MKLEEFTLEPGEQVLMELRRHWIVFALEFLPFVIAALLPFLVPVLFAFAGAGLDSISNLKLSFADPMTRLAVGIWWLLIWASAFASFTRSYLDLWIVTTTRIANIKQVAFFNRRVESFLLARVQDVTTEVSGIVSTLFGIGSVRVETAGGASRTFRMHGLPDPEAVRDLIIREVARINEAGTPAIP